jgi:hypothetical protein
MADRKASTFAKALRRTGRRAGGRAPREISESDRIQPNPTFGGDGKDGFHVTARLEDRLEAWTTLRSPVRVSRAESG